MPGEQHRHGENMQSCWSMVLEVWLIGKSLPVAVILVIAFVETAAPIGLVSVIFYFFFNEGDFW